MVIPVWKKTGITIMIKLNFCVEDIDRLQKSSISHPHPFVRRKALALLLKSKGIAHHKICETVGICVSTAMIKDPLS